MHQSPKRARLEHMKRVFVVLIVTAFLTLFMTPPASAERGCVIDILGIRVCGELVNAPLPEIVRVTIKPDPIRIPGPTITLPPRPGPTIRIPGPTKTVEVPGPTTTVTARPNIVGPSALPTQTTTVTVGPTGQPTTSRATVTTSPEVRTIETPGETRTKTETIVRKVAVGALVTLVLAGLGILALFLGYLLGQKDAKKNEDRFLASLLDRSKIRKRS